MADNNLNSFSTIISILAVVMSIVITVGGYFASNATMTEKIDRIEEEIPVFRSDIKLIHQHHNSMMLGKQRIESTLKQYELNMKRELNDINEHIEENEVAFKEYQRKIKQLEAQIRGIRSTLQKLSKVSQ